LPESCESLRQLIRTRLRNHPFVVVTNLEPYMHVYKKGQIECIRPASGVTVALDAVMQASRGLWVAHGSGSADADVCNPSGFIAVPPGRPSYTLKRVLWPLCHVAYRRPVFRKNDWETYCAVNALYADRVAEEIGEEKAFLFVQDYHFALLPRMLRKRCPRAVIAQFWHIPWPNPEVFRVCPWRHEILDGMLGNDILGFHIRYHCQNFVDTVDGELEARPDRVMTAIMYGGHLTKIRALPISIDFEDVSRRAASPETERVPAVLRRTHRLPANCILGVGADRIDYTKGLPERFDALDRLLDRHPEYRGRLVFFQAGVPSRTHVEEYRRLSDELDDRIAALNRKYGRSNWQPVIFVRDHVPLPTLLWLYRMARFAFVTSLHDGMNLVAKEFVASQVDCAGVPVLSQFTGAARELRDAVIVNPYSPDETAEKLREAIEMDPMEVRRRMGRWRVQVRENNIYKWAADVM
jgi:trehalose-6-phosphate synthase